jgi:catechol 2,3-dioxygenase-like lactoylglutathione lyase family enzyme
MNHLHINVPDVDEARVFFEQYFDFRRVYPESERLFLRDMAGFLLAIDPLETGEQPPTLPDWFHFGMCRSDPDWARSLYARMKAGGVQFISDLKETPDSAVFFCRSPGGYMLEVRGNKD